MTVDLTEPSWYLATTLVERASLLQSSSASIESIHLEEESAERRIERWRSERKFVGNESLFAERLAMDGISENDLRYLLGEPAQTIRDRFIERPAWLLELARAFSRHPRIKAEKASAERSAEGTAGFLNLIEPLILQGRERLRQGVRTVVRGNPDTPFDPSKTEGLLFTNLLEQLLRKLNRTMVLELNVARMQDLLHGDTPEERFQSFIEHLRRDDVALEILREYPVLARQIVVCVDQWVQSSVEFVCRLVEDWESIREVFPLESNPGELVTLESSAGDRHRGGRSVHVLKFGSGFQLVYKPRSVAVDLHFQELLLWLNERGNHPPFQTLTMLNCGTHGWVEHAEAHECKSVEGVERFYERQGGYLALLYSLHATDFHFENLIAAGEHPILVDLEALFHPSTLGEERTETTLPSSNDRKYSVMAVGLLPQSLIRDEEQKEGIEFSGLGGDANQVSTHRIPYLKNAATDEMRITRDHVEIKGSENLPTLNESTVDVFEYTESIVAGFTKVYRLLVQHRDELLSNSGPLSKFANDQTRYISRPTQTYAKALEESFHPDLLRDGLDRDRFFDNLWVSREGSHKLNRLFPHEREDLLRGDIPVFTTRPDSKDLWSSSDQQIVEYFDDSAFTLVCKRIRNLNCDDLEKQTWFIRASFDSSLG